MKSSLLNLGCGNRFNPAWTNVDIISRDPLVIAHNLRFGIPFETNSFDMVYHSHVLEHLTVEDGRKFIAECFRVLRPGGILRVSIPDLEDIARNYIIELDKVSAGNINAKPDHQWMSIELLDQLARNSTGGEMGKFLTQEYLPNEKFVYSRIGEEARNFREVYFRNKTACTCPRIQRMRRAIREFFKKMLPSKIRKALQIGLFRTGGEVHQWMYDHISLASLLEENGFTDVLRMGVADSYLPSWSEYELDATKEGVLIRPHSLIMEARKR